jgi:bacterioferritin (cytochrome b1)
VFWLFFLLTAVALLVLRRRDAATPRPFRVPLYPLTPLVFLSACAFLLWSSLAYAGVGAIAGLAVLGLGLVPMRLSFRRSPRRGTRGSPGRSCATCAYEPLTERVMEELARNDRAKVIDLLTERLTFERAGVKLYDRVLEVMRASGNDENVQRMVPEMQQHRDEEKEHEEWLEEQIRALGGDAHAETEKSRLVTRESKGIEEVVMSDAKLPHLLHALLAAELVDNAGWDLLVAIADEAGDRGARREFKKRLHEEEDHLLFVRRAVEKLAFHEVLGEDVKLPKRTPMDLLSGH